VIVVTVSEEQAVVYHSWNVCPVSLLPYPARKFLMKTGHSCLHCPFYADSAATHVNNSLQHGNKGIRESIYHFHFKAIHDDGSHTREWRTDSVSRYSQRQDSLVCRRRRRRRRWANTSPFSSSKFRLWVWWGVDLISVSFK
jgi:hypothetical protein